MSRTLELDTGDSAPSAVRKRKIWNNCEYVWTISDLHNLNKPVGHKVISPSFQASADKTCSVKWLLGLYPTGYNEESKNFISLFLSLHSTSKFPVFAECELSVRTSKGELIRRGNIDNSFAEIASYGYPAFVQRDLLLKRCIDNIVQIRAFVSYSVDELKSFQKVDPDARFVDAWNSVLENPKFADVVLIAEGKEIKAHKVVLSARSPVFMAMFSHGLLENESGNVKISDISVDTIRELLRFIYTNDLKIQGTDQAMSLIKAAEKYAVLDLKLLCSDYLKREIAVCNAEDMLLFADTYNVLELKQYIMEYIIDNPKMFPKLNQSKKLRENPELILELLSRTIKKFAASKQEQ